MLEVFVGSTGRSCRCDGAFLDAAPVGPASGSCPLAVGVGDLSCRRGWRGCGRQLTVGAVQGDQTARESGLVSAPAVAERGRTCSPEDGYPVLPATPNGGLGAVPSGGSSRSDPGQLHPAEAGCRKSAIACMHVKRRTPILLGWSSRKEVRCRLAARDLPEIPIAVATNTVSDAAIAILWHGVGPIYAYVQGVGTRQCSGKTRRRVGVSEQSW